MSKTILWIDSLVKEDGHYARSSLMPFQALTQRLVNLSKRNSFADPRQIGYIKQIY